MFRRVMSRTLNTIARRIGIEVAVHFGPAIENLRSRDQRTIEEMRERIATLENTLIEQAQLVTLLGNRAIESDRNVRSLIATVERLCEREPITRATLPFEAVLNDAIERASDQG